MIDVCGTKFDLDNPDSIYVNCDCMAGMRNFSDKYFDLAIIDPPYGINASNYKRGGNKYGKALAKSKVYTCKDWDGAAASNEYFEELFRVSKNQIIFGANHFISKIPYDSSCWIVWDKKNGNNAYADCELAWSSFKTSVRIFRYRWHGMLQENMKCKEIRIHPTQKPIALYEWILDKYAKPGDIILDTHVGSASSLIACFNRGYIFVGFELDKQYYLESTERINQEIRHINWNSFL